MKKGNKKALRGIAFLLSILFMVNSTYLKALAREDQDGEDTDVQNYEISYSVTDTWGDYKNIEVTITNCGLDKIEQWALQYDIGGEITNIWDAQLIDAEKGIVENNGYNANIESGEKVSFGYIVKGNEADPEYFKMCQTRKEKNEGYEVDLVVSTQYAPGFCGSIIIKNMTNSPIKAWNLSFDSTFLINCIWLADIVETKKGGYSVCGTSNSVIPANGSVSFGLLGEYMDQIAISNCTLSEIVIDTEMLDEYGEEEWENMSDTDEDGLPDAIEERVGTDKLNSDTDEDGLLDGYEVLISSTDPLSYSTLNNGISDADLDSDEDGLTTLEEYQIGTNPLSEDTDYDDLDDCSEVTIYQTDPALEDTDSDGINDGDEIAVGLDPTNPETFGYPDMEYQYTFEIDSANKILNHVNGNNTDYKLELKVNASGNVLSNLIVRGSAYSNVIDNKCTLGIIPEIINNSDGKIDSMNISFKISDVNIYEEYSAKDLQGVKRYNIFWYSEEEHILVPVNTRIDEEQNIISADVDEVGTYCVIDMEKWLSDLGYLIVDSSEPVEYKADVLYSENTMPYTIIDMGDEKVLNVENSDNEVLVEETLSEEVGDIEGSTEPLMKDTISAEEAIEESLPEEIPNQESEKALSTDEVLGQDFIEQQVEKEVLLIEEQMSEEKLDEGTSEEEESLLAATDTDLTLPLALKSNKVTSASMVTNVNNIGQSKDIIDIVFNFNNNVEGINSQAFENIKTNMEIIGKSLLYESSDVRIYVVDQNGNIIKTSYGNTYASNVPQLLNMIQGMLNEAPQNRYIDKQMETMLNTIPLREEAFKVSVFFGNTYLTSVSNTYINKTVQADIHCCIVEPITQSGSWYDKLAKATNGILIYSYTDFSEPIMNYIYGYTPNVPEQPYNMITSTGIKRIILKSEIKPEGSTDSDSDSLTDWEEINQKRITVNDDGSIVLPTYNEYLEKYMGKYRFINNWNVRYNNIRDIQLKSIFEILSEVYVLPVLSDPTMKDSDGDGILDADEFEWDGVDERYEAVGPLHEDTVETLFPEINANKENNSSYPSYITVENNDVILHLRVVFTGAGNELAQSCLDSTNVPQNRQAEMQNITNRLGNNMTLRELAIDGIKNRWEGTYEGTKYDFYKGLKVNFKVDISEDYSRESLMPVIQVDLCSGICGVSSKTGRNWSVGSNRYVTVYTSYCNSIEHKNKDGSTCNDYNNNLYDMAVYEGVVAHEFGHVFGLQDMYGSASVNHSFEIVANEEIKYDKNQFGLPSGKGIMMNNGSATTNDIEMILFAFYENEWQYYVPYAQVQKSSKAIKSEVEYIKNGLIYIWESNGFQVK